MSEYQYYEFLAIDKPLTSKQIQAVRRYSTRAEITATSFTNEYNWGNFRGDEYEFLTKWFDAMVYVANWGTHRFLFRVPANALDIKVARQYLPDRYTLREANNFLILHFSTQDDEPPDEWEEGSGLMASLAPLRTEVLAGDLRPLYLAWLMSIQYEDPDDDTPEPPVPPGLGQLSGPQKALVNFLRIDEDVLKAASAGSAALAPSAGTQKDLAAWIANLPADQKDSLLLAASEGKASHVQTKLQHQFLEAQARKGKAKPSAASGRTVGNLRRAADEIRGKREQKEAQRAAAAKARKEAQAAAARAKHLDSLKGKEPTLWRQVHAAIATRQPKGYEKAVTLLVDLRDLAAQSGSAKEYALRVRELRQSHATKRSFLNLLDKAKLEQAATAT